MPNYDIRVAILVPLIVLERLPERLWAAFTWAETPQGSDYWTAVYDNLLWVANTAMAGGVTACPPPLCLAPASSNDGGHLPVCSDLARGILGAFRWLGTPQGGAYWQQVYDLLLFGCPNTSGDSAIPEPPSKPPEKVVFKYKRKHKHA